MIPLAVLFSVQISDAAVFIQGTELATPQLKRRNPVALSA